MKKTLFVMVCWLPAAAALGAASWSEGEGFRALRLEPAGKAAGFSLLPPAETDLTFTNSLPEQRHLTNQILLNGSGVAAADVDGDGLCDLFFAALDRPSALWRNSGGWKFEEITAKAGLELGGLTATGCAFADLDGDGDADLILNTLGQGTHVYFNDGEGGFGEAPFVLNPDRGGMSLALGDLNGDGYLDIYICNYRTSGLMDIPNARATFKQVDGKTVVDTFNGRSTDSPELRGRFSVGPQGSIEENGEPDAIYLNQGGTQFTELPFDGGAFLDEAGNPLTEPPLGWGLSVMIRDFTGDGLPDIYVCNDFQTSDRFWINQGNGRWRLAPPLALRKTSLFSMGIDAADINRDGHDDFLVLDMLSREHRQRMRDMPDSLPPVHQPGVIANRPAYGMNTLLLNRGDDTYAEIAQLAGLHAADWAWTCLFLDVDLDGWEDVLISNGMERAARDLDIAERMRVMRAARRMTDAQIFAARRMFPRLAPPNLAFRNRGDLTFEETEAAWGFNQVGVSHGMAAADLDNDGDLDLAVNNLNGPAGIYRNESNRPRVAVRLKGRAPNTAGIGAKITVRGGAVPMQSQRVIGGGRYLSADDPMRVFAAGSGTNELGIEVVWPDGGRSLAALEPGSWLVEVREPEADGGAEVPSERAEPLFQDISERLGHEHRDAPFNDYPRQPLLPRKYSYLGPGAAWFDFNQDGWEDLAIGGGRGGKPALFENNGEGGFRRVEDGVFAAALTRDQTGLAAWRNGAGEVHLLAGVSNYEDAMLRGAAAEVFAFRGGERAEAASATGSSSGPVALADIDGDGDLDLFLGGRIQPGKYPMPAASRLFLNEQGAFKPHPENAALQAVGLVSGAVFTDFDLDGDPDLALACEWGPVRVFRNSGGEFTEATEALGLSGMTGWWTSIATGDFNEDGRPDLVAGNWGQNSPYEEWRSEPLRAYYGDFDGNGAVEVIEAHFDPVLNKVVPMRQLGVLAGALPFIKERFRSNRAYGEAGVEEILGERLARSSVVSAQWLETTLFLNRGGRFEAQPLPVEAQFAPVFGICPGDFDGDGHEDLILAQNFFAVPPGQPRADAGRGLLLQGDGRGGFSAVPASGLAVYGEQRGAAAADFDRDGRLDVVITQNAAATRLYRNEGTRPGLRVKLEWPGPNPDAIGASIRPVYSGGPGPLRELQAGAGYWSQGSLVQVFGNPAELREFRVRWPDGTKTRAAVPENIRELRITPEGAAPMTRPSPAGQPPPSR